jgi:hypothetical protein
MIKITDKVKKSEKVNPKSQYQFRVTFSDADDLVRVGVEPDEIEKLTVIYDEYMKRLDGNWNGWCNPEAYQIRELLEEFEIIEEDEISEYDIPEYEYWVWSNEYPDPMARLDGYEITYWDENGIEWNAEVQK